MNPIETALWLAGLRPCLVEFARRLDYDRRALLCAACNGALVDHERACPACGQDGRLRGRYRLDAVVGRGALGVTYRATDLTSNTPVAIKELTFRHFEDVKRMELCEREARVLRELDHPGIPKCLDDFRAGVGRGTAQYIVQEFIPGVTLGELMKTRRFDLREVLEYVAALLEILRYLHSRSPPVIHRDIKPSNVMVRDDGGLVLIDFGSVRDALKDPELGGSTVAGTFGYMAPEQFRGEAYPATDLYALGVLVVALLTRISPEKLYTDDRRFAFAPRLVHLHPAALNFLKTLLEPDLATRVSDAARAAKHLERVFALLGSSLPGAEPRATSVETAREPRAPLTGPDLERLRALGLGTPLERTLGARVLRGGLYAFVALFLFTAWQLYAPAFRQMLRDQVWLGAMRSTKPPRPSEPPNLPALEEARGLRSTWALDPPWEERPMACLARVRDEVRPLEVSWSPDSGAERALELAVGSGVDEELGFCSDSTSLDRSSGGITSSGSFPRAR